MRTTAEETKRNDARIIDAAIRVFSEKGYEAATMQDIADAAQISRGPLYYRYKTKKEIFLAALEEYYAREENEQFQLLRQKKPFEQRIREYLHYAFRNLIEDKPDFPMEFYASPDMEDVNLRVRKLYAQAYATMMEEITRAVREGELKQDTDVEHLVNLLFIAFDGLRYSRLKSGILTSAEKVEEPSTTCVCWCRPGMVMHNPRYRGLFLWTKLYTDE